MLETKCVGHNLRMFVTTYAILVTDVYYLFRWVLVTNIQKRLPRSKLCQQHPKIVTNFKSPSSRCLQHHCHQYFDSYSYVSIVMIYVCDFILVTFQWKNLLPKSQIGHQQTVSYILYLSWTIYSSIPIFLEKLCQNSDFLVKITNFNQSFYQSIKIVKT